MSQSVSNPVLKEFKGFASKLLSECSRPIRDHDPALRGFCECFERILSKGLVPYETLVLILTPDCWQWLRNLGEEKCGVPYAYISSVEEVLKNPRVETNRGKARLLIRACLVKKCLHFPTQYLVNEGRCSLLYKSSSVLGDPILAAVLTSILLCVSTIPFDLDLSNAQFLDSTWHIPLMKSLTFVPARCIGLSILFVEGKAVITHILDGSVAAENVELEEGDIIDSVNEKVVDKNCQGSLSRIVRKMAKNPISMKIIKGRIDGRPYPPIVHYWLQAGLDPAVLCPASKDEKMEAKTPEMESKLVYLGSVSTGNQGDLKQIDSAIRSLPQRLQPIPVTIDCHHLGLRVVSLATEEIITEYTYMDISACGSTKSESPYFAFIARAKNSFEKEFICYIFQSRDRQSVSNFLDSVGQGFKRTLYTV